MERNKDISFQYVEMEEPGAPAALLWSSLRCDELPSGVDYYLMDIGAERGAPQASRWLNLILGIIDDGVVSDLTIETANKQAAHVIVAGLELHRRRWARTTVKWKINHSSFTNRYNRARHRAIQLYDELCCVER